MKRALELCLDRRVLAGLGAIAVGITLVSPQVLLSTLPVLLVLACPLSMVFMAWTMRSHTAVSRGPETPAERLTTLRREQARLESEIAQVRREVASGVGAGAPRLPASVPLPSARSLPER